MSTHTPEDISKQFPRKLFAIKSNDNQQLLSRLKNHPEIMLCYISGQYIHVIFKDDRPIEIHGTEMTQIKPTIEDYLIWQSNQL